jgi:ferredoxin-NADP reductase
MKANITPITLDEAFMISPKVKHFVFWANIHQPFLYTPGQYVTLDIEHNGKILKRSYSIANVPKNNNRIEFAASYVPGGAGSEFLFSLKPGDTIQVAGPFGRLTLKDEVPTRYILAATGTGITPYRSMLDDLKKRLHDFPHLQIVIMQGVQKREELLYADEFIAFAKTDPRVIFRAQLSRQDKANLNEFEYSGYVQDAFADLALNPAEDRIYLCGNPGMLDEAFQTLQEKGFTLQQIFREKYISR